jgi:pimeloyl-ACP methyl ester carboxylesterase
MFPAVLPAAVHHLTEITSIAQAQKITSVDLNTSIVTQPLRTTYVRDGQPDEDSAPLLLLHGFDSSVFEYRRLQPLLAIERETYAIDLLGFGFTDRTAGNRFTPEDIDQHLYDFWRAQIKRPVVLVGASMGGAAAIGFALRHPEAVDRLVLLDSAGIANGPILGKYIFPPLDRLATDFLKRPGVRSKIGASAYFDPQLNSEDARCCAALHLEMPQWHEALIAFTKSGGYPSIRQRLREVTIPALILWGRNDKILGTKDALMFDRYLPNRQLRWIDRCGHVPHLEAPQITANHILAFVRSADPVASASS